MPDPLDQLGVEFAADHAATRAQRAAAEMKEETETGSVQLRAFKAAIMDGATLEDAAEGTGIGMEEAKMHIADDPALAAKLSSTPEPKKTAAKKPKKDKASAAPEVTTEPAAEAIPPAPGEDAETVFDRRLDRLARIVEESDFDTGTALGDMRDCILDLFKHRPKVWSAMSAGEQQDTVRAVEKLGQQILRKVVLVIAQEESESIQATFLGQFTVKGEAIEAKIKIEHVDSDTLLQAYGLAGHKVVIVSADDKRFSSQRRDAPIDPDQPEIPLTFADDAPKAQAVAAAPPPPSDDSDLAGVEEGETETAIVEQVAAATETKFGEAGYKGDAPAEKTADDSAEVGVFDTARNEWLTSEDEDSWSADAGEAMTWDFERAKEIADAFEAPGEVVTRPIA